MKQRYYARRRSKRRKARTRFYVIIGVLVVALGVGIYAIVKGSEQSGTDEPPSSSVAMQTPDGSAFPDMETATSEPTPTPVPSLTADLMPHAVSGVTDPATFSFETDISVNGEDKDTYERPEAITFGSGDEYTALEGVITFRGNNYRDAASYGYADIASETLNIINTKDVGSFNGWSGCGWTGQPLIVKWPDKTRENMTTLYDEFKDKDGFTEVIYPTLDGHIYFMELETGAKTREPIDMGYNVKGTASLDPRGYPIIYVGQGIGTSAHVSCDNVYFRAYSLIDGKELMKFGAASGDPFAHRSWQAYDASALIDAETDTLIVLGENGVMYTCDLNTEYNEETGSVTMDAEPYKVKYRYTTPRNANADTDGGGRWGMENSPVTWRNYVFFTDNAGMLQCVDLNTMALVYANDLEDDSDVSMVLEEDPENNTFYLYTGCEYDELVRDLGSTGPAYARKVNGLTGEVIWTADFTVASNSSVDGGVLASPVLGRDGTSMAGLIIFNVTAVNKGDETTSILVALDKETGTEVWSYDMDVSGWSPSSPVPVYTEDGKGYIVQCDRAGDVALLRVDGQTYEEVAKINVGESDNFEATPAVYGNMIVVGSKSGRHIFYIEIE